MSILSKQPMAQPDQDVLRAIVASNQVRNALQRFSRTTVYDNSPEEIRRCAEDALANLSAVMVVIHSTLAARVCTQGGFLAEERN